jgi:hypothetical protein
MRFLQQHKFVLIFLGLLVFCSVMVIRQFINRQSQHVEIVDAFILLQTKGYTNQASRLYQRLLMELDRLPNQILWEDFQRTLMVVDPSIPQPENLIYNYHWTVSKELEKRSERNLVHALKLAEEEGVGQ